MHTYLTSYVGRGTDFDPYRPLGADQPGWSAIDFRANAALLTGFALLALPVRQDQPGMEYLGDVADGPLSVARRNRIGNLLSLSLEQTRLDRIVYELLTSHARTDGTRWRPLRPMRDGRNLVERIYLGGLLFEQPVIAGGSTITETWDAIDSTDLDADNDWTEQTGTAWGITSNQARFAGNSNVVHARCEVDLASADHSNEVTLVTFTYAGGALEVGVSARFAAAADTAYIFATSRSATPTNEHILRKRVTGTNTTLGTNVQDAGASVVLKIEANGSTIKGTRATVELISLTDTAITTGTRIGIYGASSNAGNVGVVDDLTATDLAAVTARMRGLLSLGIGS